MRIGRWVRALGGPARNPRTDATPWPAISKLSGALTVKRLGSLQLFEKLTGSEQLWWRCCRDAARAQPYWLLHGDHDKALQVISDTELMASRGAVVRAARAADLVCRALAAPAGPAGPDATLVEVVALAADCWDGGLAVLVPEGARFAPEKAAASAAPHLQDRLGQVLACLDNVTADARQAMVAVSVLLLAADRPNPGRVVRVPVVFARPGERSSRGVAGTLELREFPPGPAGLFPDPRGMRNRRGDPAFAGGLRLAWQFAARASRSPRCVLWSLSLDGGVPDYAIDGGSLGAAFAVALRELLRVPRGSGRGFLAAPRAFFLGLRPRCAITGALAVQRPSAYEDRTRSAATGPWLDAVGDMDAKLDAARVKRLRLIAPAVNRRPAEPAVNWAHTVHQADRYARRVRPVRTAVTAATVLAVVGTAAGIGAVAQARSGVSTAEALAAHQHAIALSVQLAAQSETLGDKDPANARLDAAAAWRIAPTTQARYALRSAASLPGIAVLPDPDGYQVLAVAFSPGTSLMATGSGSEDTSNGTVQLWDTATRLPVGGPLRSAGTRQITALAFDGGNILAAGNLSGGVQLWNLRTRRATTLVQFGGAGPVSALAFGPGGILAVGAGQSATQSQVGLWDIATGKQVANPAAATYSGEVSALAFSPPDGRLLAVGTNSAGVHLWTVRDGRLAGAAMTLPVPAGIAVAFSPDGRTLATSDGSGVSFWDSTTSRRLGQLTDTSDPDPVITMAFGKDGAILATGTSTGPARLWDVASRAATGLPLTGADPGSPAVAFGPDGVTLAVASTGGTELWNTTRDIPLPAEALPLTDGANSVAFDAKTGELAAGDGHGLLHLWADSGGQPVGLPVNLPRGSAYGVAFSRDGRTIAVTGSGTRLWAASDGGLPVAPAELLPSGLGLNASFSPDGKTLAIGGVTTAQIWDVAGHRLLKALSSKLPKVSGFLNFFHTTPMAFSPDGKLLAVDTDAASVQMLGTVTYQPASRSIDSPDEIYSLAFSPDSKVLAVGSATSTRLWDTQTRTPTGPPMPSGSIVWSMAYSPDGTVLAVGTSSGIQLWDTASGQPIGGTLTTATGSASTVESLAFSHDGRTLAAGISGKSGGSVQLWNISYLIPAATEPVVCAQVQPQTLTMSQWARLAPGIPYQHICPRPVGK